MKLYEDYKKAFDFLDERTYYILNYRGKLGALLRGEEISLKDDDIYIKPNWIRQMYYKSREVPMPLTRPSETRLH